MLADTFRIISAWFTADRIADLSRALVILVLGYAAAWLAGRALARFVQRGGEGRPVQLVQQLTTGAVFLLAAAWALSEMGFQPGVLLGAAGAMTVAIGLAAQTSLSNLISGFFLFGEQPFRVGDVLEVEGVTGEVLAIDLFSTKLRTFTNHYVRIPNESMFKTKLINHTRFPIRRLDLKVLLTYEESFERVRPWLLTAADRSEGCLMEPEPLCFVKSFEPHGLVVQFSVWCRKEDWLTLSASVPREVQRVLEERGLKRPYPHFFLHMESGAAA
jgi:small-conductance mechanosensitive channel